MIYDREKISEQIPLYVNGTLPEEEYLLFVELLNTHTEIQRELETFMAMQEMYQEENKHLSGPSEQLFERIQKRIANGKFLSDKPSSLQIFLDFCKSILPSPQLAWSVVAVQAIALLLMVVTVPQKETLQTLSSQQTVQAEGFRINVVFQNTAMEQDIRQLLGECKAVIVDGPTAEGLYVVVSQSKMDVDTLLTYLRSKNIVIFAEQAL
ncbi:MAG: hypothetical protein KJ630_21810 [Proteobacteria bacterium]|nr:hypothetical protein [Pseudomonadota bacterium]